MTYGQNKKKFLRISVHLATLSKKNTEKETKVKALSE